MSRLPIRLRLTLVFALATAVVLFGAGVLVYQHVASDLSSSLNQSLRSRAQDLTALVEHGGSLRGTRSPLIERGESFAELVSRDGRVLDSTPPIGSRRLLGRAELRQARSKPTFIDRDSVPGLNERARLLAVPAERNGEHFVLVVGASLENRAETLRSLVDAFLIGGPLTLLLVSVGAYFLAGAALRPIEAMRSRAREISTASLDERLPVPTARDEVARLGETLNEMLARIEDGLARERRFVADASHELRTPLALLKSELELALRRGRSPDELQAAIRSAASETNRLERIAEDLLLLARSEQGTLPVRREPTDVTDVLESVAGRFAARAESEGRSLSVHAGGAPVVAADRLRLEQALGNLVDNALRHGSGSVRLTAASLDGSLELHVLDEGAGFPDAFLPTAFDRFSRGDESRSGGGSGLGLAIVETVARAHEGSAHAANRDPGGADVWIVLPVR
ncbi:MAG: ATP-binding protein [Actinomycetota bacterium]|nr:ATP-binding protein [Actinomycetota bacterium]